MRKLPVSLFSAVIFLCGSAFAQTGQYAAFGTGCKGSNTVIPVLSNTGLPETSKPFTINLSRARANSAAGFITGDSKTSWSGIPLPFDLGGFGATGCSLLVSILALNPLPTDANGNASVTANVPNDPALIGLEFHQQWLVLDAGSNTLGIAWSNGGSGKMGKGS